MQDGDPRTLLLRGDRPAAPVRLAIALAGFLLPCLLLLLLAPAEPSLLASDPADGGRARIEVAEPPPAEDEGPADPAPGPDATPGAAAGPRDVTPDGMTPSPYAYEPAMRKAPPAEGAAPSLPPPLATAELGAEWPLLLRPVAVDGARLAIGQSTVTLAGVAAPPLAKVCGAPGMGWRCGVEARTGLRNLLRGRAVRCDVAPGFGTVRAEVEARCSVAGTDLGDWAVRQGLVEAVPGGPYVEAESEAKAARRGLWR
ncbi:thermonuclease family protein [Aurantimonas sp. Leaf443]|uniref:thermonuclease family protein n=1 Tax=Aurantimonas sp. Leaf443 TaxID=1736378 RepID=UPI0006F3E109|nr:thermonuclease family protein [Aurantimonas sp. Leaf443]KQT85896.1 hypothetical protein ASG48_04625 [Aurantimonas sp. Leaf443]